MLRRSYVSPNVFIKGYFEVADPTGPIKYDINLTEINAWAPDEKRSSEFLQFGQSLKGFSVGARR